ncbi:hypothetical protein BST61_g9734 [Cercospora zeina]
MHVHSVGLLSVGVLAATSSCIDVVGDAVGRILRLSGSVLHRRRDLLVLHGAGAGPVGRKAQRSVVGRATQEGGLRLEEERPEETEAAHRSGLARKTREGRVRYGPLTLRDPVSKGTQPTPTQRREMTDLSVAGAWTEGQHATAVQKVLRFVTVQTGPGSCMPPRGLPASTKKMMTSVLTEGGASENMRRRTCQGRAAGQAKESSVMQHSAAGSRGGICSQPVNCAARHSAMGPRQAGAGVVHGARASNDAALLRGRCGAALEARGEGRG